MTKEIGWRLVAVVSRLLEGDEREAVRGDLTEAGESAWQTLLHVLGLILRRRAALWMDWRPWLAAFGLALPSAWLLIGVALSVGQDYQLCAWIIGNYRFMDPRILKETGLAVGPAVSLLACRVLLLMGWSWSGGLVMGSASRRTAWVSGAVCLLPCLFYLTQFRVESLSAFGLLFFVPPALWGIRRGWRTSGMRPRPAMVLAVALTALTVPAWGGRSRWLVALALDWPAWYLAAAAWVRESRRTEA